jgi:hypothetical protein
MPALGVEKPELGGPKGFDVSVAVENGKSVAILEHTGAVVSQCGRSTNIILTFDPDNVRQNETVLERSDESISHVPVEIDFVANIASYSLT